MKKKYVFKELDHIFESLYQIQKKYFNNEDLYLLFLTSTGLVKGKWYPYNSCLSPDTEILSDDFFKNQELLVDFCNYETLCERVHAETDKDYGDLILPDVTYKDIICLKDVTLYSQDREIHLPSFLLFTPNIAGFSIVKKNFKP